jgi:hypothetical protein
MMVSMGDAALESVCGATWQYTAVHGGTTCVPDKRVCTGCCCGKHNYTEHVDRLTEGLTTCCKLRNVYDETQDSTNAATKTNSKDTSYTTATTEVAFQHTCLHDAHSTASSHKMDVNTNQRPIQTICPHKLDVHTNQMSTHCVLLLHTNQSDFSCRRSDRVLVCRGHISRHMLLWWPVSTQLPVNLLSSI